MRPDTERRFAKTWKTGTETVQSASFRWPFRLQKLGRSFLLGIEDMNDFSLIKAAAILPFLVFGTTAAHAQSIRGALGPQSRASISIQASVMPTFKLSGASSAPRLSSNAPSLRYSLVVDSERPASPVATSGSPARDADEPLLMLVVPD